MNTPQQDIAKPTLRQRLLRALVLGAVLIPLLGAFLLVGTLGIGGWWLERVYLREEIRIGDDGVLRAYGMRFDWIRLNVIADSVLFHSPALDARVDGISVGIDWVNGLLALRPAARLDVDTVRIFTRGDTTTKQPKPLDSLIFPNVSLPLAVSAHVRTLVLEDSAGIVLRAGDAYVGSRGGTRARARIAHITTRWTGALALNAAASLNWSRPDSVDYGLTIQRLTSGKTADQSSDHVSLTGRHAKAPLWRGRDSLAVTVDDAAPYTTAFGAGDNIPRAHAIRMNASVHLGDTLAAALRANAVLDAWRTNPEFALSTQQLELAANWVHDRGAVTLTSKGSEGEDVRLAFTTQILPTKRRDTTTQTSPFAITLDSTRPLWEQARATLSGHARGLRVRVRDTLRTADAIIRRASWDGRTLALAITTGDSSRVEANANLAGPMRSWRGRFSAAVGSEERWVKVFVGDAIAFGALTTEGAYEGRTEVVKATVAARAVTAYGTMLDSLRTHHEYDLARGRYTLKPSRIYGRARGSADKRSRREATAWTLAGSVVLPQGKRGIAVDATLAGDGLGSLRYTLTPDGTMEATAHDFEATALPHESLDSLPLREGVLDGTFRWNQARREGRADLTAHVSYLHAKGQGGAAPKSDKGGQGTKAEPVDAHVVATWSRELFTLGSARVTYRGSDLTARARLRPQGKQFYELAKVPAAQYEYVAIEAERFDLADILKAFLPEPPLDSGVVRGTLSFNGSAGFAGNLALEHIGVKDAPGGLAVPLLRIEGRGDTLRVLARTTAPTAPWFNNSVHAELTGARGDNQRLLLHAVMNDSLNLRAEGSLHKFSNLTGQLRVNGLLALPEGAGHLRDIKGLLEFDLPSFQNIMDRGTLITQGLTATYMLSGQPRQRISLDPVLRSGVFVVPNLRIENDAGQALTGRMEYAPAKGTLTANVEGSRFSARWTDDYSFDVNDLAINLNQGPQGMRLRGSLGSGSFTYADLPLRVQGRLGNVKLAFTRPPRPAGSARQSWQADTLRVSGVLQESELRYRLRNLGDIQRVLSGGGPKRPTAGTPLVLDVKMRTAGSSNRINTDMARMNWVGDLAVRGIHPYTLLEGRVNATAGEFGLEREAYTVRRLDMKWLNAPVEEGEIHMEARKELGRSCTPSSQGGSTDSCTVIARLDGSLADVQFSYDSDCGGAYGAGANVAAILYSVQRGCYDASITSGEGRGYGERALTLLEPTISRNLTSLMGPFWGAWVETAEVSGLGSLSPDDVNSDSVSEALSLALTSREYRRFRIKVRSGYHLNSQDLSSPMENMLALEWRIPLPRSLRDSLWRERLNNNLRAAASVETRPVRRGSLDEDEIERKIGLFYNYAWWGEWWARKEEGLE